MRLVLLRARGLALSLIFVFVLSAWLGAQPLDLGGPAPGQAEPEDVGIVVKRLANGTFLPLEMHHALKDSDFSFFSGQLTYVTIPNPNSPVRFRRGEKIEFILKVFLDSSDPRAAFFPIKDPTRFSLFRMERNRNDRRIVLRDEGFTDIRRNAGRPLLTRLWGQTSFLLVPSDALEPGEYALKYSFEDDERFRVFCFGVDEN